MAGLYPNQKGDRVRAAFVRYFDASPQKLDELAAAAVEKAIGGDTSAAAFIRDTMDGKPAQQLEHIGEQSVTLRTMVTTVLRDHDVKRQQAAQAKSPQQPTSPSTDTRQ